MSSFTITALTILMASTISGCATWTHTRVLEAEERVIICSEIDSVDSNPKKIQVMCSEPSPDALKTLAASMNVEKQEVAKLAAAYSEAGANIGLRTHSIQLLRDQLFAICQGYANKGISGPAYQMMLTRNQRNTVALMAIEQLTGVLQTPAVKLSGSASIGANEELIALNQKLKVEAETKYNALTAAQKTETEGQGLKKQIDEYTASIERAKNAIVAATANAENSAQGGRPDAATIGAIAEKVKEIAIEILSQNDLFYVCLDMDQTYANLKKDLPAALRARCDKAYTNLDPRSIQSGSGSGSGSATQ